MSYKDKEKQAEYNRRYYWKHRFKLRARQRQRYRESKAKESRLEATHCDICEEPLTWRISHEVLDKTLILCLRCYKEALKFPDKFYQAYMDKN